MSNTKSIIPKAMDKLLVSVLDPPTPEMAAIMIHETARLHIAALTGLLKKADNQSAVDSAYDLIDTHLEIMRSELHEVMYVIAKHNGHKPKGLNDTNLQTRLDIEAQLRKEESNV